jgi:hypothetical protein
MCGGKTSRSDWKYFSTNGMYVDVDTTACNLPADRESYPYVTTVEGNTHHWMASGTSSVYHATATGFRLYLDRSKAGVSLSQAMSNGYNWHVNWAIDVTGSYSGCSPAEWTYFSPSGIYRDTSTASAGYLATPRYVTSVHGNTHHWTARGTHMIYNPSKSGFRTYLYTPVNGDSAKKYGWQVCWLGVSNPKTSGQSGGGRWKNFSTNSAYMETLADAPRNDGMEPVYVTSMQGGTSHWSAWGGGSLYWNGDKARTYINGGGASFWNKHGHNVNWVAAYVPESR